MPKALCVHHAGDVLYSLMLETLLEDDNFEVVGLENGNGPTAGPFDLIVQFGLSDDRPEDGLDRLAKLRARFPGTPIIVVSGYHAADMAPFVESHRAAYFERPGLNENFLNLVRALVKAKPALV
jgi:DNA-binding NtrC family response regulator